MLEMLKVKQPAEDIEKKRRKIMQLLLDSSAVSANRRLDCKNQLPDCSRQLDYKNRQFNSISTADLELIFRLYDEVFLQNWFRDNGQHTQNNIVCGIRTNNALEALLLVFEHELCHVLEFLFFGKSSCKGGRFKTMASNVFGHTESYHRMPTTRQIAAGVFGFRPGDVVSFDFKEKGLQALYKM